MQLSQDQEDKWYNGTRYVIFMRWRISCSYFLLELNAHLSSTPINASPMTAAASYRLPINSGSSPENSSSHLQCRRNRKKFICHAPQIPGGTCQNFDRYARPIFFGFEIWPNPIFLGWQIF